MKSDHILKPDEQTLIEKTVS